MRETVEAARYLAARRAALAPRRARPGLPGGRRRPVPGVRGRGAEGGPPGDWLGLGGWCVLGRWRRRWLPAFWETLRACLPLAARAGVRRVHLFGVLWPPALGGLLWLADRHGLAVSTDSSAPLLAATWPDPRKAGVRAATCRGNVAWWRRRLVALRGSPHYRAPPVPGAAAGAGAVTGTQDGGTPRPAGQSPPHRGRRTEAQGGTTMTPRDRADAPPKRLISVAEAARRLGISEFVRLPTGCRRLAPRAGQSAGLPDARARTRPRGLARRGAGAGGPFRPQVGQVGEAEESGGRGRG